MAATIRIKRGQALRIEIPLQNADESPFDMTGMTLASEVRQLVENVSRTYDLVGTFDTSQSDLAGGNIVLIATAADTNAWVVGTLYFDVWVDDLPIPTMQIVVEERITGYD